MTDDQREARRAYMRAWRRGIRRPVVKRPLPVRLLAKTDRVYGDTPSWAPELGRCWIWMGALSGSGYGVIRDEDGRLVSAHRAALAIALGRPVRPDRQANHHCDNPRCVRPRHLYEGTAHENVWDCLARGRHRGFETADESDVA